MRKVLMAGAAVLLTASAAQALPVGATFFSTSTSAAAGTASLVPGFGPGGGVPTIALPAIPYDFLAKITVTDCCLVGDVYAVAVDGVVVGITAAEPINGPTASVGVFFVDLQGTFHTIDITDITLNFIGQNSPFGGGIVPDDFTPAGLSVNVMNAPEPVSMALLGTGLLGLGLARRRKS